MAFEPVSAGIFGALQLGTAIFGANSRNRAIKKQFGFNQRAAVEEIAQQGRVAEIREERARRNFARTMGLISVSAAERGVGMSGTVAALERNAAIDAEMDDYAMETERYGAERRTLSGLEISQLNLESGGQSMFSAGLTGATQGLSTGLSIGRGIGDILEE